MKDLYLEGAVAPKQNLLIIVHKICTSTNNNNFIMFEIVKWIFFFFFADLEKLLKWKKKRLLFDYLIKFLCGLIWGSTLQCLIWNQKVKMRLCFYQNLLRNITKIQSHFIILKEIKELSEVCLVSWKLIWESASKEKETA